jgi:hypothetical protein
MELAVMHLEAFQIRPSRIVPAPQGLQSQDFVTVSRTGGVECSPAKMIGPLLPQGHLTLLLNSGNGIISARGRGCNYMADMQAGS